MISLRIAIALLSLAPIPAFLALDPPDGADAAREPAPSSGDDATPFERDDPPGATTPRSGYPPFRFDRQSVDDHYGGNGRPGWVRAGDMDLDGDLDIVAGGGNALFIYLNGGDSRSWRRTDNLDGTGGIGANAGLLVDVDLDGDLDVISALYYKDVGWWENPGGDRIALAWVFHTIVKERWFLHDLALGDIDNDGKAREVVANLMNRGANATSRIASFRIPSDPTQPWPATVVQPGKNHGNDNHAGLDIGDIDSDGKQDIAFANGWYESPSTLDGTWIWHPIHDRPGVSNVILADLDRDGRLDVVTALGHRSKGLFWYAAPAIPAKDAWSEHVIHAQILQPESLGLEDLDGDGDLDVVTADLDDQAWALPVHNVYVFENLGSDAGDLAFRQHNVAPNSPPSHLLRLLDIDQDGHLDIISESCGHSVISFFRNRSGEDHQ
ncbi:MAG: VCBS repeat-containing protein [Planctomycetes bacterium]|nr:VCBS repeat-containing protein [Planctomycetota bacterium]